MSNQKTQFGCLPSLFWLIVTFALTATVIATRPSEIFIRTFGGFFQILGIVIVASGIRELRREFKVPTWREGLRAEIAPLVDNAKANWRRWLRRPLATRVITGTGKLHLSGSGTMTASGHKSSPLTVEQRLELLTVEIEQVKSTVREFKQEFARHTEQVARDLAAEGAQRAELEGELTGMITSLAVGGLNLEIVGVCWLFAGTVLTTWPCELARWLGGVC